MALEALKGHGRRGGGENDGHGDEHEAHTVKAENFSTLSCCRRYDTLRNSVENGSEQAVGGYGHDMVEVKSNEGAAEHF